MNYYLFEQSGGIQTLRTDNPEPGWGQVPDDAVDAMFAAMAQNLPVCIRDGALDVGTENPGIEGATWSWATRQWGDARTLERIKAEKRAVINNARMAADASFFMFQGKQIALDAGSRSSIAETHGTVLMTGDFPQGWPGGWKAVDNTYVAILDVATWARFYSTMAAHRAANFNRAQELKIQVDAAATADQVLAVPRG